LVVSLFGVLINLQLQRAFEALSVGKLWSIRDEYSIGMRGTEAPVQPFYEGPPFVGWVVQSSPVAYISFPSVSKANFRRSLLASFPHAGSHPLPSSSPSLVNLILVLACSYRSPPCLRCGSACLARSPSSRPFATRLRYFSLVPLQSKSPPLARSALPQQIPIILAVRSSPGVPLVPNKVAGVSCRSPCLLPQKKVLFFCDGPSNCGRGQTECDLKLGCAPLWKKYLPRPSLLLQ